MAFQKIREVAEATDFPGVVLARLDGERIHETFGYRDRANGLKIRKSTRFGIASGTKGFTAIGIAQLIEDNLLKLDSLVSAMLGDRLNNLHPAITVRHLLGHTSGVGDYLDEESKADVNDITLAMPVQSLNSPFDYVPMILSVEQISAPGERFSYSDTGYVLLAMIIEVVAKRAFPEFIESEVFRPAGMNRSGFFRSDCLPSDTAKGYLAKGSSDRTNVFHLPVIGSGDGGAYVTVGDMELFWRGLLNGLLLRDQMVSQLFEPRVYVDEAKLSYGYGFWLDQPNDRILLEGYDPGVSFRSSVRADGSEACTVVSNTSSGAWPIIKALDPYFQRPGSLGSQDIPT